MENNNSTLRSTFTLGDCGAAIGRQCSRLWGSNQNDRDNLEAYIPGQTEPGPSSRDSNRRRSHPTSTSCSGSRGPGSCHPNTPISSQAQIYHRSYPDRQTGLENGTARYSTQLTRFQQNTQPSMRPPMQYPIPSPRTFHTSADSRNIATAGRSSRLSSSSSQIPSGPSSSRFRESTRESYSRGTRRIRAGSGSTILRPNGYAYVSADMPTRREATAGVASHQLDDSRYGKEHCGARQEIHGAEVGAVGRVGEKL
ncbi:uncharacterized protein Bfra_005586 [Botrytis fragariae]|uniref:Uncharacterized protein n=1 Tax=Botrytis fragariae TaxID=1964551 RepID=A0A8H6ARE6_9HELO|nr:uncharacterized protein Bfra_005586 [Botrytis fragariae]KAF5872232.1 hypothetical protein Bfra_005586 [Botrytis fragariae]